MELMENKKSWLVTLIRERMLVVQVKLGFYVENVQWMTIISIYSWSSWNEFCKEWSKDNFFVWKTTSIF